MYPNARFGIGRLSLPDLKRTLCIKIKEHLHETGIDYRYNQSTGSFTFGNGSTVPAVTWGDGNLSKLGSLELSGFAVEEVTETKTKEPWDVLSQRVGRQQHIPEQLLIGATNPDSPSSWAYKRLVTNKHPNVHCYFSKTFDNPYLPDSYTEKLKETLDAKMVRRMVYGEWLELSTEVLYYSYDKEHNYKDESYEPKVQFPIHMCWDFNIGAGKPFSMCFLQYVNGTFHVYNEVVMEGQRTGDMLDEMYERGLINGRFKYIVNGDRNGKNNDTRSKHSDYSIIDNFLSNVLCRDTKKHIKYEIDVPLSNPPIRTRHNLVNGAICNSKGDRHLFVYRDAPTVDEGLRLTKLKAGGQYTEDDKDSYQHITTALGYSIVSILNKENRGNTITMMNR